MNENISINDNQDIDNNDNNYSDNNEAENNESSGVNEEEMMIEYNSKNDKLLQERKVKLYEELTQFTSNLEKEKDFDTFVLKHVEDVLGISENFKDCVTPLIGFLVVKVLGTVFITLYFIGILEVIGILNTLEEEILCSIKFTLRGEQRETSFYENYINENLNMPSFDLFFLSAIFSDFLINSLSFPLTVILVFLLNSSIILFGLDYFEFHQGELLNVKYTSKENIYLLLIYFSLYSFLGLIALTPHEILKEAYLLYDAKKVNKGFPINGHIFVYLFSMVVSSIVKLLFDRNIVFGKIKTIVAGEESESFFSYNFYIILIYGISTISSLVVYFIYSCFFKDVEKTESDYNVKAIKIFGYLIYIESNNGRNCVDCCIATEKCGLCLGFNYCNCCACCTQVCMCFNCCKSLKADEATEGKTRLCIIYKIKGLCSWIFDLLAAKDMNKTVVILYVFELINLGFKPKLETFLNEATETDITVMNIISFSSIIILYLLNLFIGFASMKFCSSS